MEYTVLGDTVNTASRLESFDKEMATPELADRACRILIGESTWELLDGQFQTRCVGTLSLKGKAETVTIHLVLGEANATTVANDAQREPSPTV